MLLTYTIVLLHANKCEDDFFNFNLVENIRDGILISLHVPLSPNINQF